MEIPSGWFEVIRGPRPPSVRWPQAHDRQPPRGQPFEGERGRRSGPGVRPQSRPNASAQSAPQQRSAAEARPRLTPAQVASNATSRVSRLERCIAQLSPDDSTELRALQAALEKARAQTVLPHPAKQVEDCQQYCSRAKRRLEKAQEAAKIAQEAVVRFEAEFQDGLRRLEELKAEAAVPPLVAQGAAEVPPTIPADFVAEVNQLRAAVQDLTRERDTLRAGTSGAGQPTQTVLAVVPAETRNPSDMMATLIEEADTDLRRSQQGRFAPY